MEENRAEVWPCRERTHLGSLGGKTGSKNVNIKGSVLPHEVVHALCLADNSPLKDRAVAILFLYHSLNNYLRHTH